MSLPSIGPQEAPQPPPPQDKAVTQQRIKDSEITAWIAFEIKNNEFLQAVTKELCPNEEKLETKLREQTKKLPPKVWIAGPRLGLSNACFYVDEVLRTYPPLHTT